MSIDNYTRCLNTIHLVDQELDWQLSDADKKYYATRLQLHISEQCSDTQLRKKVRYYHLDYEFVEALRDRQHANNDAAWKTWLTQVIPILYKAGLSWSSDASFDIDDLAQIAQIELLRSISSFHYSSRFSTWAHQVTVQSIQRTIRDSLALKRAVRPDSLDLLDFVDASSGDAELPEEIANARALANDVQAVLAKHPDTRLVWIFQLRAIDDLSVEMIGKIVKLHPSRVRALLAQARDALRNAPEIQSWRQDIDQQ